MSQWRDIESAPKDGSLVLCCWAGGDTVVLLRWKTNDRITQALASKDPDAIAYWAGYSDTYYGDPVEWDDYDLAKPGNGPTHWLPYPPIPALQQEAKSNE